MVQWIPRSGRNKKPGRERKEKQREGTRGSRVRAAKSQGRKRERERDRERVNEMKIEREIEKKRKAWESLKVVPRSVRQQNRQGEGRKGRGRE